MKDISKIEEFDEKFFEGVYAELTHRFIAECEFVTEVVGGVPADLEALTNYAIHQMKVPPENAEAVAKRIMMDQLGGAADAQIDVPAPEGAELEEKLSYGLCSIRKTKAGPYIASHMIHACLKAAASRVGIFQKVRGSKGDMIEMGRVEAAQDSLILDGAADDATAQFCVHLYDNTEKAETVKTHFITLRGRVNNAQGSMSIVSDREAAPPGSRFCFQFSYSPNSLAKKEEKEYILKMMAAASNIGLGSGKAFAKGKFRIKRLFFVE